MYLSKTMVKVSVNSVYTSVGCNRIPEITDWNNDGLICFGATNAVVIYDTNVKGKDPLIVLSHHRSLVNSVKWLCKPNGKCMEFVSCSADKTAAIWTLVNGEWKVTSSLTGHKDGVTTIHGIYTEGDDILVFTGCIDSNVRVWERTNGMTNLKHTINLNSGLCLTLHSHLLPSSKQPILFCALDDHKIHVYTEDQEYYRVHTLVGHEDWVRGLDVLDVDDTTILLASASQDTYIRLWRIQLHDNIETLSGIKVEEKVFHAHCRSWSVKLEAVLAGHEGWVYGVQWHPYVYNSKTDTRQPVYRLLSSSLDKTLIIWEPESSPTRGEGEGAWVERVRVGEVGGNGLGFYGSRFGPDGTRFMGHGYNGSFHMWSLNKETKQWGPVVVIGGHFGSVEEVRWSPSGQLLISAGLDQTTRAHAAWTRADGLGTEWHEIARPQVHGYDMASLALVSPTVFASAAEEKVIRVFQAPHNFVQNYRNIVGEDIANGGCGDLDTPEGALVPSLGLSNKAVFVGDDSKLDMEDDNDGYFVPIVMTEPPTEETLMQNTLWPETHKLYGHGYEVFALAASPDGQLLASACRATVKEHAAVILWETKTWQQIQKLISHSLTVTQLEFSPNSQQLLSVSRDRRWTLFEKQQGSEFNIVACTDKTNGVHTRIIWCCGWAIDGAVFGTGSREGKICLWTKSATPSGSSLGNYGLLSSIDVPNASVTALAFAPRVEPSRIIAAGFDSGLIQLYRFDGVWSLLFEFDHNSAHHLTVKRLTFKSKTEDDNKLLLASCSTDHFVRIHSVTIYTE